MRGSAHSDIICFEVDLFGVPRSISTKLTLQGIKIMYYVSVTLQYIFILLMLGAHLHPSPHMNTYFAVGMSIVQLLRNFQIFFVFFFFTRLTLIIYTMHVLSVNDRAQVLS